MPPKVSKGRVIFRRWSPPRGLYEQTQDFESLDDLFALCLQVDEPPLIDRIVIEGQDADGNPRVLTFNFQSLTITRPKTGD
ncbi:MAG: hypothetical protein Kow00120_31110 [Anaerolineae bacterium]